MAFKLFQVNVILAMQMLFRCNLHFHVHMMVLVLKLFELLLQWMETEHMQ